MLKTYAVAPVVGQVRFVTMEGSGYKMTVECPGPKWALLVNGFGTPAARAGAWVRISGTTRVDSGLNKKTGEPYEQNLSYWHDPLDGTPRRDWWFFEMRDSECVQVPPPAVSAAVDALEETSRALRAVSVGKEDPDALVRHLARLSEAYAVVRRYYGQIASDLEPVRTVEVVI